MKRFIQFVTLFLLITASVVSYAQTYGSIEKFPLKNGLQKVKSGPFYGMYDANDNVIVSVEYADFVFVDDIAILTKEDGTVHGYVKYQNDGAEVFLFDTPYEFHPQFPFYWNGYLPVRKISKTRGDDSKEGRWMFLDENGNPIFNPLLNKRKLKVRLPYTFFKVNTFSDGYAVVTTNQNQIIHIDKKGNKSFTLPKDEVCYFRSSVYKGECVMVTDSGVKLYQENPSTKEAQVKLILVPYISKLDTATLPDSLSFDGGKLHFDLWGRTKSFVPTKGEVVYFIEPIISEKKKDNDTNRDSVTKWELKHLEVRLVHAVATATDKGYAKFTLNITNNADVPSDTLNLTVKSDSYGDLYVRDINRTFVLQPREQKTIPFDIPARFSEDQQKHRITVTVANADANIEEYLTVTVRRITITDF